MSDPFKDLQNELLFWIGYAAGLEGRFEIEEKMAQRRALEIMGHKTNPKVKVEGK